VSIDNFYTTTVYEKGAEVVRMYRTLLGPAGFRRGMDLYFARHDGQAVTCDDFRAALADANGADLSQFGRWYEQRGTPLVEARGVHDARARTYTLTLEQSLERPEGVPAPPPLHIPVAVGLVGPDGRDLPLRLEGEAGPGGGTRLLELRQRTQSFVFADVAEPPIPSLLRGFSAPVRLRAERTRGELAFLMANDSDAVNRWDAGQALAQEVLLDLAAASARGRALALDPGFSAAWARVLADDRLDGSLKALALTLPSERILAQEMAVVDPDALHAARRFALGELARLHRDALHGAFAATRSRGPYRNDPESIDRRRLKHAVLAVLTSSGHADALALLVEELAQSDNMSDTQAALAALVQHPVPERDAELARFHERWHGDPLVLDKWFALQASASAPDTCERVLALAAHPAFTLRNPNRVRALVGEFSANNPLHFHAADGRGYVFLADQVLALDPLNPQVAARLASAFNPWRRYDPARQAKMRGELTRIATRRGLSKDVGEIVGRALDA
jgi:aminopeptidase N